LRAAKTANTSLSSLSKRFWLIMTETLNILRWLEKRSVEKL
jgi:hypothetical protein